MHLRELPTEEPAIRRFLEDLWLPYHRDLEDAVERHAVAEDLDDAAPMDERIEFWMEHLEAESYRAWIAVDAGGADRSAEGNAEIEELGADLVGFVTTDVEECPNVFDGPDQLMIGDLYVAEEYRGSGLATRFIERAAQRAEEAGCGELTLNVDVDNERALAFYEKMGFEPSRHRMYVATADVAETGAGSDPA